ncbi:cysteinyl-tRNA synthetase [Fistulifera solaris]|uniref:cysteine--tRNA ligase n=1 Tax=Fistulifera solaris TaxID=1519565 RepID=A0A1Z5K9Y5_FISSO|nr:cysteinyl-tRNA synthetase [Fistulifera solaris]|eukprot:GAX23077.1 cysteinyl-tRNA synthetase [Fistulifera solaris]
MAHLALKSRMRMRCHGLFSFLTLLCLSRPLSIQAWSITPKSRPVLQFYNSETRTKQPLTKDPAKDTITMYTCGPTVYDAAHLGNFRAFLTYDVMKRVLQYFGYKVEHVCNLTDVDDKIIKKANAMNAKDAKEITVMYEQRFLRDLDRLNIVRATHYPRATEHIPEMMQLITNLQQNGLAYETKDGSWYFRTRAQPKYGQRLVQNQVDDDDTTVINNSDDDNNTDKEHPADFCLWKAFKEGVDRDDLAWSSTTISRGRPGWHLECSAMSRKFFPRTLDFHGGGHDLKFPHHENEIAQSEGAFPDTLPFCNCWFHNGFVTISEQDTKMSKSLGNFLTLESACPTPLQVRAYRYLVVTSQYRQDLKFTTESMQASTKALKRMDKVWSALQSYCEPEVGITDYRDVDGRVQAQWENFETAIADDLSMPRATACLFALIKLAEQELKSSGDTDMDETKKHLLQSIALVMRKMDQVLGVFYTVPEDDSASDADDQSARHDNNTIPERVQNLVEQRKEAKKNKDYALADQLRQEILECGFVVQDGAQGVTVMPVEA